MKTTKRTKRITTNLAKRGVKATVTKSRTAIWQALQGCGDKKPQLEVLTTCHSG